MHAHYQRLKELDSDTFQRLCFQILKDKHPGLELRHVEGSGGDQGLDVFEGKLFGQPAIWQCKSFPNGVGASQREQIKNSLRTALKYFSPSHWILCLSIDMDPKAYRWFEKLQKSYAARVRIGLFSASDIVHELIHRRSVRNEFFPGAVLDSVELKRIVTKTGELTLEELERLTENSVEDFIERLKDRDARFNYQIVFDGDIGPRPQGSIPGLVVSFSNGTKTLNVIARDVQALMSNPPELKISLKQAGIEKAIRLRKTGIRQEFTTDDLGPVLSDWALLTPLVAAGTPTRVIIEPSPQLAERKRAVRLTFRNTDTTPVHYGLLEMIPTRIGTDEAELICRNDGELFEMRLVVSLPIDVQAQTRITISHDSYVNKDVKQIEKFLDAMSRLRPSGQIEIFDLKEDKVFATLAGSEIDDESGYEREFHQLIKLLGRISDRFKVRLRMPDSIADADWESLLLLKTYLDNGTLPVANLSLVLVKDDQNRNILPSILTPSGGLLRAELRQHDPMPKLFGQIVDTGPCSIESAVIVNDLEETLRRFSEAAVGDGVSMSFRPTGRVRFALIS